MARDRFLKGATLLAGATIVSKLIGALYRIPLTNILGAEGIGLYQLIFPLYALVLTLSSGAVPNAVAIVVSGAYSSDIESAKKRMSISLRVITIIGIGFAVLMACLAYPLSLLQRNEEAVFGYLAIAPAVAVVSAVSVYRGYFQGKKNMRPTSISNIVEGVVKLVVGLLAAWLLKPLGTLYSVIGALVGVTVSEIVTLIVLGGIFKKTEGKLPRLKDSGDYKDGLKSVLRVSVPMAICGVIANLTQFIDSVAVVPFLEYVGKSASEATKEYGLFSGPVSSLISLPVVVGICLSVAIIPSVSTDKNNLDIDGIKGKTSSAVKLALSIGLPFAAFFAVAAEGIISCLYPTFSAEEVGVTATLLRITSVSCSALLLGQILVAVMQALGYIKIPIRNYAIGAVVKVTLDFFLMPYIGVYGVAVASAVNAVLTLVLNAVSYIRLTGRPTLSIKVVAAIVLSTSIISAVGVVLVEFSLPAVGAIVSGAVGVALYIVLVATFGVFSDEELSGLPLGKGIKELFNIICGT